MATSFNPPEVWQPFGAFALAAVQGEGRPVHLKGQVALDRDGRLVGKGDMRAQVRQVLENIRSVLASVGGQMGDIISLTQYTTDMDAFIAAGDIRKQFFKEPYPVTTTVQVTRLYDPDLLIEITALAEIPPDRFRAPATSQGAPMLERRDRKVELGTRPIEPGIRSGRMSKGGALIASLEGATMHEHGLERAATKRRSGWLNRATGSRPSRGSRKLIRRARTSYLNLAFQGGGAHGAFTWGVLDRVLEAERFRYEGISGTSAGAINAVVLASGWLAGGAAGAQASLAALWHQVAEMACPLHRSGLPHAALDATTQLLSPYQLNPLYINPLRDLLERLVDFERLRRDRSLKLFIAATTLRTGTLRMFENRELSADAVLASACLPWLHQAVEIEGEAYWDGGYVSNPPLLPLVERCRARDLLLVRINSSERSALPKSAGEIRNRVGEIVFDQPLERELALLQARRGAPHGIEPRATAARPSSPPRDRRRGRAVGAGSDHQTAARMEHAAATARVWPCRGLGVGRGSRGSGRPEAKTARSTVLSAA